MNLQVESKIDRGANTLDRILVWLRNARSIHHRLMANYIRKRGWVAFYLEGDARVCKNVCWLKEYQQKETP